MTAEVITLRPSREVEERPRVDISGGVDGCRVFLLGKVYAEFATISNASRCASALRELDALGCAPAFAREDGR